MNLQEAIRIIDAFSNHIRAGVTDNHLLGIATLIQEFELERDNPAIAKLFRMFSRNPKNIVAGDSLCRRLRRRFENYILEDDDPFIPHPAPGEIDGEIRTAKCTSGGYFGREKIEFTRHEILTGSSGCGKTTLQLHTFDAMNRIGVRCIVISSVKRSYRKLIQRFPNTLVIRCGAPDEHYKFNPFELPENANINQAKAVFTRCLSESEQIYIGTENYISSHLADLFKQKDSPTFRELLEKVRNDKPNYKEPRKASYKDSALGRLIPINNTLGNMFDCKKGYPLIEILKHNNIILEEDALNPSEKQLINSLFLAWLFLALICQNLRATELKYWVIIDEGHDVFNQKFSQISNPIIIGFLQIVREAGIGVSVGCQNPSYIDGRIFGNTATTIAFNLVDGRDIKRVVDSMGFQTKDQIQEIYKLKIGEAIVRKAGYPRLFKIRTEPYDLDASVSDSEVIKNNNKILSNYSYVPLPSDVLEIREEVLEIDRSEEKEQKKEESKNTINEQEIKDTKMPLAEDEKKLLVDIYTRCYESVNSKLRSLGFSGSVGNRLKKTLIEKGYIAEYPIKLGEGRGKRGKILILLDKAESAIEPAQKIRYGRSANLEHSFIQQILKCHLETLWPVKAKIEEMRNGKSIDIAITKNDGTAVAIEYERTSLHARENIEKDLAAGFEKVITVCGKNQVLEEIKKIVDEELSSEKERVSICLLKDVLTGAIEI